MPEQPTSQEKDLYFKLRDDKNVRDVSAYDLIANPRPGNPYHSHPVFVQGAIAPNNAGDEAGMVTILRSYQDSCILCDFLQRLELHQSQRLYRMQECDTYERLGLGDLIDANTGNYQKPILQLFDQLNQDTKASAVFRAFVTFKLLAVAQVRPDEWGFSWCPSAAAIFRRSRNLAPRISKAATGWCRSEATNWTGRCRILCASPRRSPGKTGPVFAATGARLCAKGFVFAGLLTPPATLSCGV
jgi:hypothetical protein